MTLACGGHPLVDFVGGGVVAAMLGKVAGGVLWGSLADLLDSSMSEVSERLSAVTRQVPGVIDAHVRHRQVAGRVFVEATIVVKAALTASGAGRVAHAVEQALCSSKGGASWAHVHVDVAGYAGETSLLDPVKLEEVVRERVLSVPQIEQVVDIALHYGADDQSRPRVNVSLNIVLPLQYRLEVARRVASFAIRRLKALPFVDHVDIDVELPEDSRELDMHHTPMVPARFSGLLNPSRGKPRTFFTGL